MGAPDADELCAAISLHHRGWGDGDGGDGGMGMGMTGSALDIWIRFRLGIRPSADVAVGRFAMAAGKNHLINKTIQ